MRGWRREQGEMVIEATLVFPVVFFVIFFLIYFGNVFYLRSKVESVTDIVAVKGASYYTDPMLTKIKETGSAPTRFNDIRPYRYWFKTASVESEMRQELAQKLGEQVFLLEWNRRQRFKQSLLRIICFMTLLWWR